MRIFNDSGIEEQSAYFGWQNEYNALYGLIEGYKNSADDLVEIAIASNDIKIKDTYIFPILFSYRHCIELFLKDIYFRCYGEFQKGSHNLLKLWDEVSTKVIDEFINNDNAIEEIKGRKENFIKWSLNKDDLTQVRKLLKELQEVNQTEFERENNTDKQVDRNAEVWRYLFDKKCNLYFSSNHFIDYVLLKESINYVYKILDYIYFIVNEYLSS